MVTLERVGDSPGVSARKSIDERQRLSSRESRGGCLGLLLLISALPILLLAVSAVTGVGLNRNLPSFPAAAGDACPLISGPTAPAF